MNFTDQIKPESLAGVSRFLKFDASAKSRHDDVLLRMQLLASTHAKCGEKDAEGKRRG